MLLTRQHLAVHGPLLFILFENNTASCVADDVSVKLFADDAKMYTVIIDGISSASSLQHCLDQVVSWAVHWQLKPSPSKFSVMRIKPECFVRPVPAYRLGSFSLHVATHCTDLGVSYDNHSFSSHIKRIITKPASRPKSILRWFVTRDSGLLTRAFCEFVRPLLEFSSVSWSPYYKNEIFKIVAVKRPFTKSYRKLTPALLQRKTTQAKT
jgi:hypothetical protein